MKQTAPLQTDKTGPLILKRRKAKRHKISTCIRLGTQLVGPTIECRICLSFREANEY